MSMKEGSQVDFLAWIALFYSRYIIGYPALFAGFYMANYLATFID